MIRAQKSAMSVCTLCSGVEGVVRRGKKSSSERNHLGQFEGKLIES